MNKKKLNRLIICVVLPAVLTAVCGLGLLDWIDNPLSDALYLREEATDGEIIVVGIDERAIEKFGSLPWNRSVYADAIDALMSSQDCRPAVIALDVLFSGHSSDSEADARLVQSVKNAGNVVIASVADFGSEIIEDGTDFFVDEFSVLSYDKPFDELYSAGNIGLINAMTDNDGIIRHAIYSINISEAGCVKTMPRVVYEMYSEYNGLELNTPDTDEGFFYLSYTAKPGAYYEDISIADVIDGSIEPDYFDGKIVLIGPYSAGLSDSYLTSIDHADPMFGIEIQANHIDAYRKGFFPKTADTLPQLAAVFAAGAVMLWLFMDSKLLYTVIADLCVTALSFGLCLTAYKLGYVLHTAYLPSCIAVIMVFEIIRSYVKESEEKKQVKETFGKYVDPGVIRQLLEHKESINLGGKKYDIAVLFVDIRGFTTMSESLEPETIVEILNEYLTLTTECIMRYHGTLDKFVGDCTMAFWNAPLPQEDPVYLACRAAMDMAEGAKVLGKRLEEKYGKTVGFGIGVHYGPAVVGNIGAPMRMDYTAIGDTVNTSSRLESNAPAGTVYISRVVADALGDRAQCTSLGGSIKLKGKKEGFEVLTLDSISKD